jgi:hypothetical protein
MQPLPQAFPLRQTLQHCFAASCSRLESAGQEMAGAGGGNDGSIIVRVGDDQIRLGNLDQEAGAGLRFGAVNQARVCGRWGTGWNRGAISGRCRGLGGGVCLPLEAVLAGAADREDRLGL